MSDTAAPFSFRLEPEIRELLTRVSQRRRLPETMMLEQMIVEQAEGLGILPPSDPQLSLLEIYRQIKLWLEQRDIRPSPDFTREVFSKIESTPEVMKLWRRATKARSSERAEKRKQAVNARLGRFCKYLIGWESAEKVILPRNDRRLIAGYTRLSPPRRTSARP